MPQDEQICRAYAKHHYRMPVQTIEDLTPSRPREKLTHGQRINVAEAPAIEISRTRMMEGMVTPPIIVWRQGHDTDYSADPIVRETAAKERAVAAVVLDHEETDEQARRGRRQQQADPMAATAVIISSKTARALSGSR
jgi:hypothetical protein